MKHTFHKAAFPSVMMLASIGILASVGWETGTRFFAATGDTVTGTNIAQNDNDASQSSVETPGAGVSSLSSSPSLSSPPSSSTTPASSAATSSSTTVTSTSSTTTSSPAASDTDAAVPAATSSDETTSEISGAASSLSSAGTEISSQSESAAETSSVESETPAPGVSTSSSVSSESSASSSSSSSDRLAILRDRVLDAETVRRQPSNIAPSFIVPRLADYNNAEELKNRLLLIITDKAGVAYETDFTVEQEGADYRITLVAPSVFQPGAYRLRATFDTSNAATRALQRVFRVSQETPGAQDPVLLDTLFDWGMIAANTNQDRLMTGEAARINVALLNNVLEPACVAAFELSLGADEKITREEYCTNDETFTMTPAAAGPASLIIRTVDDAQEHSLTQEIPVDERASVARITRESVTYAQAESLQHMRITVSSMITFIGTVREAVPAGFEVIQTEPTAEIETNDDGTTTIVWSGAWEGGTSRNLSYIFRTPSASPTFALFGPVEVRGNIVPGARVEEYAVSSESTTASSVETSDGSSSLATGEDVSSSPSSAAATSDDASSAPSEESLGSPDASASSSSSPTSAASSTALPSQEETTETPAASQSSSETPLEDAPAPSSASSASSSTSPVPQGVVQNAPSFLSRILSSILASLTFEENTMRLVEERRWQMLVAKGESAFGNTNRTLTLQRVEAIVPADGSPSFTLVETNLPAGASLTLANGDLKKEIALQEVLHAIIDEEQVADAIITHMIEKNAQDLGGEAALSRDVREAAGKGTELTLRAAQDIAQEVLRTDETAKRQLTESARQDVTVLEATRQLAGEDMQEKLILELSKAGDLYTDTSTAFDAIVDTENAVIEEATTTITDALAGNSGIAGIVEEALKREESDATAQRIQQETAGSQSSGMSEGSSESTVSAQAESDGALEAADETGEKPLLKLRLIGPNGQIIDNPPFHFKAGSVVLALDPIREFTPGLYTLEVIVTNPLTDEETTMTQQFAWGVLAMNPNKDRFAVNETARIDIGVLDNRGEIVCDATLTLQVTDPEGLEQELSTAGGGIHLMKTCGLKQAGFIDPDYTLDLPLGKTGTWALLLTAEHKNGIRTMRQTIIVDESPFRVERIGATRLWPFAPAPQEIRVHFFRPFIGVIVERVPADFVIGEVAPEGIVLTEDDGSQTIRWSGAWEAGHVETLRYIYDAPDISPQFYLLGPLELRADTDSAP